MERPVTHVTEFLLHVLGGTFRAIMALTVPYARTIVYRTPCARIITVGGHHRPVLNIEQGVESGRVCVRFDSFQ